MPISSAANSAQPKCANVMMCGNSGYFQHIAVCLASLLDSNRHIDFRVVVLGVDYSDQDSGKLVRSLQGSENLRELRLVDFSANCPSDLPLPSYLHAVAYGRFFVEDYFSGDVERVIYLDGDMVVVGAIDELLDIALGDNVLAAVTIPNSGRSEGLGYDSSYGYFNSGVLVINLPVWRAGNVRKQLVESTHEIADRMKDGDQCVLNYCLHARRAGLDYTWNSITPFFRSNNSLGLSAREVARVVRDARIVHFNGASKPWQYMCMHPFKKTYLRYLSRTEWRDFRPSDANIVNFCKKSVHRIVGDRLAKHIGDVLRQVRQ